ncbi:MAG TPA: hypothetical protein VNU19_17130, partial [Candidatus Acidoferrum sp.]|nr:hypothetical protein [Candidatus Acidoferrum sp.]
MSHSRSASAVELVTADDVLRNLANGFDTDGVGVLANRPVIVLSLDGRPAETELERIARELPCVVVGVAQRDVLHRVAAEFDVMLTREESAADPWVGVADGLEHVLEELVASIERTPRAAVTLVQTLRIGAALSDDEALTLESLAYGLLQGGPEHARWLAGQRRRVRPSRPGP